MANNAPVGVFDSGVGGLSVLREIHQRLPQESLLYLADSAHVPYGEKSADYIRQRCQRITEFLLKQGAKALVVACNTATAAAVNDLRAHYPQLPVVGMEPALKPAVAHTQTGVVGVLATTGTLNSARFAALLERYSGSTRILTQPCPGLVELIEEGQLDGPKTRQLLERLTAPLLAIGCDTLILGCTHYPFIKPLLQQILPPSVSLIDTGAAVASRLQQVLSEREALADGSIPASVRFWSTGDTAQTAHILPKLWGESCPIYACYD